MAAGAQTNEVDNALRKLLSNPGVTQYVIFNSEAIPIKMWNMKPTTAVHYCALVSGLIAKCNRAVPNLLEPAESTIEYLRLHTEKNKEIMMRVLRYNFFRSALFTLQMLSLFFCRMNCHVFAWTD